MAKNEQLHIRLSKSTYQKLVVRAKEEKRKLATMASLIIENELENEKPI